MASVCFFVCTWRTCCRSKRTWETHTFLILSGVCYSQPIVCKIVPHKNAYGQYETPYFDVFVENTTNDTVCVQGLTYDYCASPMALSVDGKEMLYDGPSCTVLSGVYVRPRSKLCYRMAVTHRSWSIEKLYKAPEGQYVYHYNCNIVLVKNRRPTRAPVSRLDGEVKYIVRSRDSDAAIAEEFTSWIRSQGKIPPTTNIYEMILGMIENNGVRAIDRVLHHVLLVSNSYKDEYAKRVWRCLDDDIKESVSSIENRCLEK